MHLEAFNSRVYLFLVCLFSGPNFYGFELLLAEHSILPRRYGVLFKLVFVEFNPDMDFLANVILEFDLGQVKLHLKIILATLAV